MISIKSEYGVEQNNLSNNPGIFYQLIHEYDWKIILFSCVDSKQKLKKLEVSASLRILIAEDNPINLKVAQLIVNPFSGFLETAADGLIAYNKFREDKYDMILMDLQMPVLNGYESTKLIREYERMNKSTPVKIVAMTANAMKEDEDLCLSIGMDAYLSKPFRMVDMIRILKKLQLVNKS